MIKNALAACLIWCAISPTWAYEAIVIACHDGDTIRVRRQETRINADAKTSADAKAITERTVRRGCDLSESNDLDDVMARYRPNKNKRHEYRERTRISNENVEKIRLAGIDAPELAQPFGIESRNFLEQLILGKRVEVDERATDKYGRTVAEITTVGGVDINHKLVECGFAWCYPSFAKKDKALFVLQAKARHNSVGLWSKPDPEAPWVYRKQMASEESTPNL